MLSALPLGSASRVLQERQQPDAERSRSGVAPTGAEGLRRAPATGRRGDRGRGVDQGLGVDHMNKIEVLKAERDGLDVTKDLVRFAREGWRTIADDDKERLKWVGVFHRKPTPGHFMMRIRMANGIVTAAQARLLGEITKATGRNIADVTTRQQIQLRWVTIEGVPDVIARLGAAGLSSLQTGMDNIRGIVGCPATGLTPHELFDTAPIAAAFQRIFLGNKAFTNLPRKFNVTITGCLEHCTAGETQDISMTPAISTPSSLPEKRRTCAPRSPSSFATTARARREARPASPSSWTSGEARGSARSSKRASGAPCRRPGATRAGPRPPITSGSSASGSPA